LSSYQEDVLKVVEQSNFEIVFRNLREQQRFKMIFTNEEGITGERDITITPKPDTPPAIEAFEPEIVRKTAEGYKITANARIPFRGIVQDNQGLARLRFAYTL